MSGMGGGGGRDDPGCSSGGGGGGRSRAIVGMVWGDLCFKTKGLSVNCILSL